MTWTDNTWPQFCALLDNGWPGELTVDQADAYRVLLDGTDPAAVIDALRRLLHRGNRFRPSAAELLSETHADPSRPTFEEAYRLIFGANGVLAARRRPGSTYATNAEARQLDNDAATDRAAQMHPLVGAFVARQGLARLRELPVDDPDYGQVRRKELRDAWDRHVEAFDGREITALAAGGNSRAGLRRLDPLAALGVPAVAGELTSGQVPSGEERRS